MASSLWRLGLGLERLRELWLGVLRESNQALEEEENEGKPLLLSPPLAAAAEVVERRVALWMDSRGVTGFDCLPKVKGKCALTPSYISASSSIFDRLMCFDCDFPICSYDYTLVLILIHRSFICFDLPPQPTGGERKRNRWACWAADFFNVLGRRPTCWADVHGPKSSPYRFV